MDASWNAHEFVTAKDHAVAKLSEACDAGRVDAPLLPVLSSLNALPQYYTLSSCSGRTLLLQLPRLGDKANAVFLGRWHEATTAEAVKEAATHATTGYLWLLAQSPILHVAASDLAAAEALIKAGNAAGFKNSAVRSLGKRIIVELASTERLDVPVGFDGRLLCSDDFLGLLVQVCTEIMSRSADKVCRLTRTCAMLQGATEHRLHNTKSLSGSDENDCEKT
jgi:tRNA wybutosine-synthesizing protein 3